MQYKLVIFKSHKTSLIHKKIAYGKKSLFKELPHTGSDIYNLKFAY